MMKIAKFTEMTAGDKEDYDFLEALEKGYASKVGARLYLALQQLDDTLSGYQVTRLEHSLQTATRAYWDGADIDWIVCALLHDIGDVYAPYNHDQYAAVVLAPYVREQCRWVVEKHGIFQRKYYAQHTGGNPDAREQFIDHPFYQDAVYFCGHWDQRSFDPDYATLPLAFFEPMLREVFNREVNAVAVLLPGVRVATKDAKISEQRRAMQP